MSTITRNQFPCFRLFIVALAVSFGGSFHFGYQLVITNPSQTAFLYFVNLSFTENYGSVLTEANLNVLVQININNIMGESKLNIFWNSLWNLHKILCKFYRIVLKLLTHSVDNI